MEDFNPIRRWFAEWRGRWHNVNGTAVLRLGDAAGESKLSVRNSNDEEVFYFASNGTSNIEPVEGETGEALLRGGSRSLLGNLVVADGVTVDGVTINDAITNFALSSTGFDSSTTTLTFFGSLASSGIVGVFSSFTGSSMTTALTGSTGRCSGLVYILTGRTTFEPDAPAISIA